MTPNSGLSLRERLRLLKRRLRRELPPGALSVAVLNGYVLGFLGVAMFCIYLMLVLGEETPQFVSDFATVSLALVGVVLVLVASIQHAQSKIGRR